MTIVTIRIHRRRLSFVSLSSQAGEGAWLGSGCVERVSV